MCIRDRFSTAGLVTRMTTDVTNLQNAFQMMERMCVRAPVHLVFALIMAFGIGGPLALIFVAAFQDEDKRSWRYGTPSGRTVQQI